MIYCFAFGFAMMRIYCHGSCLCLIGDYSMVIHDQNGRITVAPYTKAEFDVYDVVLPFAFIWANKIPKWVKMNHEMIFEAKSKILKEKKETKIGVRLTSGARTGSFSSGESSMMMIVFSSTSSMAGI